MTTIFGTLGFTPEKLLPTVAACDHVSKVVFYHDDHERSAKAAQVVRRYCWDRGVPVESHTIDGFDVIAATLRMRRDILRAGVDRTVFNLTGGTAEMTLAATLACFLEGAQAVSVHAETREQVALPLFSLRCERLLKREPRRVLALVAQAGAAGVTQADIARDARLAPATVNHHVTRLREKGLVVARRSPADARKALLTAAPSARLFLEGAANPAA